MRNIIISFNKVFLLLLVVFASVFCAQKNIELGKEIFFDKNLSANKNQSCAECHGEASGWTGPDERLNKTGAVYEGSFSNRFGNRKPGSCSYASLSPVFSYDKEKGFLGGNFWDGRATGWKLGNPTADQAQGPPLNPLEQALTNANEIMKIVCNGKYGKSFEDFFGTKSCRDSTTGFDQIAVSLFRFESSQQVNKFNSKFDMYLNKKAKLTASEQNGFELFTGKARCDNCHSLDKVNGSGPAFTNFTYHNIGIPRNPQNPFYNENATLINGKAVNPEGQNWVDPGLAGFLSLLVNDSSWRKQSHVSASIKNLSQQQISSLIEQNRGKFRVPTLRNVDKRPSPEFIKAYTHNGYFKSLKSLVHYYNRRNVITKCSGSITQEQAEKLNCMPLPETSENLDTLTGNLGLTNDEENAIVDFLSTLSDK